MTGISHFTKYRCWCLHC